MTEQTYWVVRLAALSFATKEEAEDFRNRAEDVLMDMPYINTLTFATAVTEESDE